MSEGDKEFPAIFTELMNKMTTARHCSGIWKQSSTKWWKAANEYFDAYQETNIGRAELGIKWALEKATADRTLKLLTRVVYKYVDGPGGRYVCAFCYSDQGDFHADNCEFAKELEDDND